TFTSPYSFGLIGVLVYSGAVQPQDAFASMITKSASPSFLKRKTVSAFSPIGIVPKSCTRLSNAILGKALTLTVSVNFCSSNLLTALSLQLKNAAKVKSNKVFFIGIYFNLDSILDIITSNLFLI